MISNIIDFIKEKGYEIDSKKFSGNVGGDIYLLCKDSKCDYICKVIKNYKDKDEMELKLSRKFGKLSVSPLIIDHNKIEMDGIAYIVIIMEYIKGLTLREWLTTSSNYQKTLMKKKIIKKINIIHKYNFIHGDLHFDNIIIDKHNIPFIIDFGTTIRVNKRKKCGLMYGYTPNSIYCENKIFHNFYDY
jgi:tRNA A-37 threonylcarbamoyl transferase component Bud32